jgi:replicative superfamily II helicase
MQKHQDWEQKFTSNFGLRCAEVTGDTSLSNQEMANADIILSTPEKWDSGQ